MVAKRYDKAFFLQAEAGSEVAEALEIYKDREVLLFAEHHTEHVRFDREWTHANFERWIVLKSVSDVFMYDRTKAFHLFAHQHLAMVLFRDGLH